MSDKCSHSEIRGQGRRLYWLWAVEQYYWQPSLCTHASHSEPAYVLAGFHTNSEGQMVNGGKRVLQWRKRWISLLWNQLLDITWHISTGLGTRVQFREERDFLTACLWITVSHSYFQKPPSVGFLCWSPAFLRWSFLWALPSTLLWTFHSYSVFSWRW